MNKYQFKNKTELGTAYYYCYGDDRFENWLRIKNIKFKKLNEKMTSGKNLFNEQDKKIERLQNIIDELEKWLEENKKISQAHENVLGVNIINLVLNELKDLKEGNKDE